MMLYVYIQYLIGKLYKILPMKENQDAGVDVHLQEYLDALLREVLGSLDTFPEARECKEYLAVVNVLQFLCRNEFDLDVCRRDVFKMLNLLDQIVKEMGGAASYGS